MEKFEITIGAYDLREKTVTKVGNSGHALVPQSWIGKKVKIILLEPIEEDQEE